MRTHWDTNGGKGSIRQVCACGTFWNTFYAIHYDQSIPPACYRDVISAVQNL